MRFAFRITSFVFVKNKKNNKMQNSRALTILSQYNNIIRHGYVKNGELHGSVLSEMARLMSLKGKSPRQTRIVIALMRQRVLRLTMMMEILPFLGRLLGMWITYL